MKPKEAIINFIKKYKIESIAVFIVSFIAAYLVDLNNEKIENSLYEVLCIFILIVLGSFLIDKIFIIYEDIIKKKIEGRYSIDTEKTKNIFNIIKIISYTIVAICGYIFYRISIYLMATFEAIKPYEYSNIVMKNCSIIIVSVLLIALILYFVIKEKKIDIKNYFIKIFINFLFVFLVECIVLVGILILYFICEALLGTIPYYIISRIISFIISIISLMGFLVGIENVKGDNSLFSKILVRYIMQIMVLIGFMIFYIYLIKIIIRQQIPSNQVFAVCTTLFTIGLSTSLMSLAINEKSIYNKIIKYLPIAFIPALIMQIISISLRINQHGLTIKRYFCIAIIVFEIIYLIHYVFDEILKNSKIKLKNVFLIFNILMLIIFFIPKINVYEFPKIYNKIFNIKIDFNENKYNYHNKYIIQSKNFTNDNYEVDIKDYDKLKTWAIEVEYDDNEKKYFYIKEKKEYDNSIIDITNTIDVLKDNIKNIKEENGYPHDDVFMNIKNEIVTGNHKMVFSYIYFEYDKELKNVTRFRLSGFLLTNSDK